MILFYKNYLKQLIVIFFFINIALLIAKLIIKSINKFIKSFIILKYNQLIKNKINKKVKKI